MSDIQVGNEIAIVVEKFDTEYEKVDGELIERDCVFFRPIGDRFTQTKRWISEVAAIADADQVEDNLARMRARAFWQRIEPEYTAWKAKTELPVHGTPLAAWSGVADGQARVLNDAGIRTVEELADAPDVAMTATGLRNWTQLRLTAQQYVKGASQTETAERQSALEATNQALQEQLNQAMAMLEDLTAAKDEPKRRGRPPKQPEDDPSEAQAA